jgi:hypothetical protein
MTPAAAGPLLSGRVCPIPMQQASWSWSARDAEVMKVVGCGGAAVHSEVVAVVGRASAARECRLISLYARRGGQGDVSGDEGGDESEGEGEGGKNGRGVFFCFRGEAEIRVRYGVGGGRCRSTPTRYLVNDR